MAKEDLKDAFRIIPIHLDDHRLLGFTLKGFFKAFLAACLRIFQSLQCILKEKLSG